MEPLVTPNRMEIAIEIYLNFLLTTSRVVFELVISFSMVCNLLSNFR